MADVAAQLVLHPTASQAVAVLGTTLGRDKVCTHSRFDLPMANKSGY